MFHWVAVDDFQERLEPAMPWLEPGTELRRIRDGGSPTRFYLESKMGREATRNGYNIIGNSKGDAAAMGPEEPSAEVPSV